VSREDTFARDLDDDDLLERELLRLAVRVSADLRRQALRARTVTVKVKDTDFRVRSAQRTLGGFIESEGAVLKAARPLLRQLRRKRRVPLRLLGIALSHFDDEDRGAPLPTTQLGLFAEPAALTSPGACRDGGGDGGGASPFPEPTESARDRALTRALDRIRERYGSEAILPARLVAPAHETGPRVEE